MPVNDLVAQLQLLVRKSTPLIELGGQSTEQLPDLTPGQQVEARVLSPLPGGRFLVLVDDKQLDLNLPRGTQAGDKIDLRFVGNQPRPTFVLADEAPSPSSKPPVNLSDNARFLGALLDKVSQLAARQDAPVRQAAPVVPGAPPPTPQFAAALRAAVGESGLFYESHQAQWVAGERSLAQLLKEPQAQLSEPRAFAAARAALQAETAAPAPAPEKAAPSRTDSQALPHVAVARNEALAVPRQNLAPNAPAENGPGASQASVTAGAARTAVPEDVVHPQAAPLAHQQLEMLDTRQLVWQGQVWPGQTMHWQIEEDSTSGHASEDGKEWSTSLKLTLPRMGEVEAHLRLGGAGVQVDLRATQAETLSQLQNAALELRQAFDLAGLSIVRLTVTPNG